MKKDPNGEEQQMVAALDEWDRVEKELAAKEEDLNKTIATGQDILHHACNEAIPGMQYWLNLMKTRWQEVTEMCHQKGTTLEGQLTELKRTQDLLDQLLLWLRSAELTLGDRNQIPLPRDNRQQLELLLAEHVDFENEMLKKQPDYEEIIRTTRKNETEQDAITDLKTPLAGNKLMPIPADRASSGGPATERKRASKLESGQTPNITQSQQFIFQNPVILKLYNDWRRVWLMGVERRAAILAALDELLEVKFHANELYYALCIYVHKIMCI